MTGPVTVQPRRKLPDAFALAVACCRWTYCEAGEETIRRLAKGMDWGAFLATCRRHRIQGLASHALAILDVAMPAPIHVALGGDARAIAEQGLVAAQESARLADAFGAARLPLLFLKGLTAGQLAYGNPFLKMSWDIDLLVAPEDLAPGAALLGKLGFALQIPRDSRQLASWHESWKESVWRRADGVVVELHTRVADHPDLLPGLGVSSPRQTVGIAPGISLPTFAEEELFAYLCVHGASSAWFRLKWITDLAGVISQRSAEQTERLYARSQELGAGRAAAQALLLASMLYDIPLTAALGERLDSKINRWLADAALGELLRGEPTRRPFGTRIIHLTQFFLLDGAGYKWSEFKRQLSRAADRR